MSEPLYEEMIRIVKASVGADGHVVSSRMFTVYVGHHGVRDSRGRSRRFSTRYAARRAAREFIIKHNQANLPAPTDDECCMGHARGNPTGDPCDTSEEPKREVSTEAFDAALVELIDEASASELLAIPGLYEIVSEFYNNEAIDLAKGE